MVDLVNVNWLAILTAAVVYMMVGMVWYSKLLFSRKWTKLVGMSIKETKKDNVMPMYLGSFLVALLMAFVLAQFLKLADVLVLTDALRVAVWAWLGFIAPFGLTAMMFQGKPPQLFLIDSGYYLVSLMLMAVVLYLMA